MKRVTLMLFVPSIGMAFVVCGCKPKTCKAQTNLIERSPEWGSHAPEELADSVVFVEYTPKATFTTVAEMEAKVPTEDVESILGKVNEQFLDGCYYTGDTSTLFLASFAERWNKTEFLRRFVNAEKLFERENTNYGDSLTSETVRGKMPLLPNEYLLAFRDAHSRVHAKKAR